MVPLKFKRMVRLNLNSRVCTTGCTDANCCTWVEWYCRRPLTLSPLPKFWLAKPSTKFELILARYKIQANSKILHRFKNECCSQFQVRKLTEQASLWSWFKVNTNSCTPLHCLQVDLTTSLQAVHLTVTSNCPFRVSGHVQTHLVVHLIVASQWPHFGQFIWQLPHTALSCADTSGSTSDSLMALLAPQQLPGSSSDSCIHHESTVSAPYCQMCIVWQLIWQFETIRSTVRTLSLSDEEFFWPF